ncbi:MAG: hypothetical protein COA41_01955, partial [Sphingopyxis sp.]
MSTHALPAERISYRTIANIGASALALSIGLAGYASGASAQILAGDPECPVNTETVECSGNLSKGVSISPSLAPQARLLTVRNLTGSIAPKANVNGIDFFRFGGPVTIITAPSPHDIVVSATTLPDMDGNAVNQDVRGIRAYTVNGDVTINNALNISGDQYATGSGSSNLAGILAISEEPDEPTGNEPPVNIVIDNIGDITLTSGGKGSLEGITSKIWGDGKITIRNSGDIIMSDRPVSTGSGSGQTGISALVTGRNADFEIVNDGDITFAGSTAIDINGHLLLKPGAAASTVRITNNGDLTGIDAYQGISYAGVITGQVNGTNDLTLINNGTVYLATTSSFASSTVNVLDYSGGTYRVVNTGSLITRDSTGTLSDIKDGGGGGSAISLTLGTGFRKTKDFIYIPAIATVENSGTIDVEGFFAVDIIADKVDLLNTGDITTRGYFNSAIYSGQAAIIQDDKPDYIGNMALTSSFENRGSIATSGTGSNVVRFFYVGAGAAINSGTLASSGDQADGLSLDFLTSLAISNSGKIVVTGAESDAVSLFEYSVDPAYPIFDPDFDPARDLASSIDFVTTAAITASGVNGDAIQIEFGTNYRRIVDSDYLDGFLGTTNLLIDGTMVAGGSGAGVGIRYIGQGTNTIDNQGTITAASGHAIISDRGAEIIFNRGAIDGTVSLGAGDDLFHQFAGATVSGVIDLGDDDDSIIAEANSLTTVPVLLGNGDDRVLVRAGSRMTGTIDTGGDDDVVDFESGGRIDGALLLGSGNDTLYVRSGSTLAGAVDTGDGDDLVSTETGGLIAGSFMTGDGADIVTLLDGTVAGAAMLGAGDDIFQLTKLSSAVVTDGGSGEDTALYTVDDGAALALDLNSFAFTAIETFAQAGSGTLTISNSGSVFSHYDLRGGMLVVNADQGLLAVDVRAGTRLGGTGTVGSVTISGGTLTPGGAGGTGSAHAPTAAVRITAIAPPPQPAAVDPLPLLPQLTGKALARAEGAGGMIAGGENAPHRTMIPGGENAPHAQMIAGGENIPYLEMIPGGENEPHAIMIAGGENIAFADGTLIPGGENVPYSQLIHGGENIPFASGQNIGTLTINGDLIFDANSFFEVEVDDQGNGDRVVVLGSVSLGNATLRVLDMLGGGFAGQDPFNYLIIDNDAMDAVNGVFGSIT